MAEILHFIASNYKKQCFLMSYQASVQGQHNPSKLTVSEYNYYFKHSLTYKILIGELSGTNVNSHECHKINVLILLSRESFDAT